MNSSPGKPMSSTARGVGFAARVMEPTTIPSMTPTMVLMSSGSALSAPSQDEDDCTFSSWSTRPDDASLPSRRAPRASPEEDSTPPWSREAPSELDISLISTSLMTVLGR